MKLAFELLSLTSTGRLPALAASSTVAVGEVPPGTELGAKVILVIFGVNTLMLEVIELLPTVAVTCDEVSFAVTKVVTGNVAVFAPAATCTVAGTVDIAFEHFRATVTGVAPAFAFNSIVAVEAVPPITDVGAKVILMTLGVNIERFAVTEAFAVVAVITEEVSVSTAVVVTWNVAVAAPTAISTFAGTDEILSELVKVMTTGALTAFGVISTVAVAIPPPITEEGAKVSLEIRCAEPIQAVSTKQTATNPLDSVFIPLQANEEQRFQFNTDLLPPANVVYVDKRQRSASNIRLITLLRSSALVRSL